MALFSISPTVVIVDDRPQSIEHLRHALSEQGCQVKICDNADEAIAWVAMNIVDVVLLDVNLDARITADRRGIDLAEQLAVPMSRHQSYSFLDLT